MPITIQITADTFEQMVKDLGGVVKMFVAVPMAAPEISDQPATPPAPQAEEPVEAEVVDPPKKPRGKKAQQTIEGTVNPTPAEAAPAAEQPTEQSAPTTATEPSEPAKPALNFEDHIRPAIIQFTNDVSDPKDPASKGKVFRELIAHFGVTKSSEIPAEKYQEVLDYIAAKSA